MGPRQPEVVLRVFRTTMVVQTPTTRSQDMAATKAMSRTRRTNRITRSTDRRGAHAPVQEPSETGAPQASPVTPAFHITPNS